MGLFSSSKSKSSTTIDDTDINNVDNRVTEADIANIGGNVSVAAGDNVDNVSITTTDFGAVDRALDTAESSFTNSLGAIQSSVGASVGALRETAKESVKVAEAATRDESARTMQFVVLGVVIVGTAFVLRKTIAKAF